MKNAVSASHIVARCQKELWHSTPQNAQKGRPARLQRAKGRGVRFPLSDARTPLEDFFSILLV